ncbi:MAG: alkaline phosphatase [Methanobacterium sp.]|jgi:alkaline phosphatase
MKHLKIKMIFLALAVLLVISISSTVSAANNTTNYTFSENNISMNTLANSSNKTTRNVIFFHPDGYGVSHWNSLRFLDAGPDGRLNWDRLPHMAPYTGHMRDALTGSSHGGATTHAYGVKVARDSFGMDGGQNLTALSGKNMSIMEEAVRAGFATALIQTGGITEAGTAVFVASVEERGDHTEIARQVIESGVDVILSGGERWLLPMNVTGRHGNGTRTDDLNLITRAIELGYTVVYTRDELLEVARRGNATRVLGVFAWADTFHTMTEEALRAAGLPLYVPGTPTIAEMSEAALKILSRNPKAARRGMFIVAEEEATDNLPNVSNARGSFEAGRRADDAFRVFIDFVNRNPKNTLLITAADSSAGSKDIIGLDPAGKGRWEGVAPVVDVNTHANGTWARAPMDGIDGAGTALFLSGPDRKGNRWPFAVSWATRHDVTGGILARAKGLNAEMVTRLGVVDNTDIYRIMYYTLFGSPTAAASLRGGDFRHHVTVNLTPSRGFSPLRIFFTTDGSTPTNTSRVFNGTPLVFGRTTTLRFFAQDRLGTNSTVYSETYNIYRQVAYTYSVRVPRQVRRRVRGRWVRVRRYTTEYRTGQRWERT